MFLLFAAVFDLRKRRIPNWLVIAGSFSAALTLFFDIQPFNLTWPQAVVGALIAFFGLLIFYSMGLMGAGDIKFAGVLGLWMGWQLIILVWTVGSVIAGLHGIFILATRCLERRTYAPVANEIKADMAPPALFQRNRWKRETPYAACLAAGAVIVLFWNSST
ncbi:prepilin peptidase [Polaromonas sp. SM01]|uniref:A24 family peptidase n=1 Tax=Polaromonas sp. SM01 TaxID=3085630 RepID=UPI002982390E|nr:prepilin peptidase [Polaromonas sp. SM01]MDW5441683.1 prepilin peptidase [Polaromonas sp. SM01]